MHLWMLLLWDVHEQWELEGLDIQLIKVTKRMT